ncbi:hypothetical protein INR49_024748, partial [Caranx melampygus]
PVYSTEASSLVLLRLCYSFLFAAVSDHAWRSQLSACLCAALIRLVVLMHWLKFVKCVIWEILEIVGAGLLWLPLQLCDPSPSALPPPEQLSVPFPAQEPSEFAPPALEYVTHRPCLSRSARCRSVITRRHSFTLRARARVRVHRGHCVFINKETTVALRVPEPAS